MAKSTELDAMLKFITTKRTLVCITGAGISTASGIPDYRGPSGSYSRGHKPMLHQDFISSAHVSVEILLFYFIF